MGRPLKVIDWDTVDKLCAIQCTGEEIAAFVSVHYETLNTACLRDKGVSFPEYFAQKAAPGKISLRRAQFQAATDDRNATMMIWLGKQMLGQNDKQSLEHTGEIVLNVTIGGDA
jgi:hypothetical protein